LESKKLAVVLILVLVAVAPLGYIGYAYHSYSSVINPGEPLSSVDYVVVKTPDGKFYSATLQQFNDYLGSGGKVPQGAKLYKVRLDSYLTGSPVVDINTTVRSLYDSFTIVLGDPSVKNCKDKPGLFLGSCTQRTAAVMELSAFISNVFTTAYYVKGLAMGYNNTTARAYAYNQTLLRNRKDYLSFWTKVEIGRGSLGNSKNLAVLLIGPAEGAQENRIFVPRKGLLVIEGLSDETLRAEVVLVEQVIGFQWPNNSTVTNQ
jgi:hypothetical protein